MNPVGGHGGLFHRSVRTRMSKDTPKKNANSAMDAKQAPAAADGTLLTGLGANFNAFLGQLGVGRVGLFVVGFAVGAGSIWLVDLALTDKDRQQLDIALPPAFDSEAMAKAPPVEPKGKSGRQDQAESLTVAALESEFEGLGYDLKSVRANQAEVPRVLPASVPHDLPEVQEVNRKKALFLRMVLPLVLTTNERLLEQRARLTDLHKRAEAGEEIIGADKIWLGKMFESYKTEPGDFDALIKKVDVVPPSLALAQAAVESGWGTSRFAREGNALFGQWVWGDEAKGIVPEKRQEGKTHKIKAFDTPLAAVAAYIKNLNTHRAYRKLRAIRAELRAQGARLNGAHLAEGLEAYSEKGMEYVDLIRGIISHNKLRPLDRARLADTGQKQAT